MTDKFDSFLDLLREGLGDRLTLAEATTGLLTDEIELEFPVAPAGTQKDSKIARHLLTTWQCGETNDRPQDSIVGLPGG